MTTRYSASFCLLAATFVACLITANIVAVKIVAIGTLTFPAGLLVFPISYIFGDVLTEVYGYRTARLVIWLGFACNLLAVIVIALAQALPSAPFWNGQTAYEQILGYTPRLLIASFAAYLCGEFANSFTLAKMKILTEGRRLWTRTVGSTLVGQAIDSSIFITIAFVGAIPSSALLSLIATQWLLKTAYEVLATPLTYKIVNHLKRTEGIDTYDRATNFSPLPWAND